MFRATLGFRASLGGLAALVCLLAVSGGCRMPALHWSNADPQPSDAADAKAATAAGKEAAGKDSGKADPPAELPKVLATDQWAMAFAPGPGLPGPNGYYWRHQALEAWQVSAGDHEAALATALAQQHPVPRANAAILLARAGDARGLDQLAKTVADSELRLPLRSAAAEAIGHLKQPAAGTVLDQLTDELGRYNGPAQAAYVPRLHAELLTALAAHSDENNPRFSAALESPAAEVRRAAVRAWLNPARSGMPEVALELRTDPDPQVRSALVDAVVSQHLPPALEYLTRALDDLDASVRLGAIVGLGKLGGDEARARLDKLRTHKSETVRAAVVGALAGMGAFESVLEAAHDKSWHVRQVVAQSLRDAPRQSGRVLPEAVALAETLAHDSSIEVQKQAIAAIADWPLADCGSILLAAISEGGYQTRRDAARSLATNWPPAAHFPFDSTTEVRTAAASELRRRWLDEFGLVGRPAAAVESQPLAAQTLSPERVAQVRALVEKLRDPRASVAARQQAVLDLIACGPMLIGALDESAQPEPTAPLPPAIYEDVLPKVSGVFAALEGLRSAELRQRRAASTQLVVAAGGRPLVPLALLRMTELTPTESDPVVWQSLLVVTAGDDRQQAVDMAYLAIGNPSADVRRRACDYLAAHPDPRHVPVLLPALDDPSPPVLAAAVRALGAAGSIGNPQPLVRLLLSPDKLLRVEVASSLAQLKVSEGPAALERLALDPDNEIRRRAAQAMGQLHDEAYLPTLIELVDGPVDVQHAAFESLARLTGQDFSREADGLSVPRDEQARRWLRWYRDRQAERP
jgi:HEAT repeat protein